jgi:acetyl-CoA carboxylase biotin carboxylase subunit
MGKMFNKILIANRGEIAVRIIRACREMGLTPVSVFSEADRESLHVRYADEAYYLGAAPSRESYLRSDKIIQIAKDCGAEAIHPGYGFLAERDDFGLQVEEAGLTFIGPRPSAIAAMGDKAVARATVASAGIPVVPGTEGEGDLTDEEIIAVAPKIGFPLLIKATAGGGGKGMREAKNLKELPHLLPAARREAEAAFGDGNVYLEKLLLDSRHIEFQILADDHGNVVHLGERECSLQRRHQKLLEESPSPFIDDDLRKRMGQVACKAAEAVDYLNAGTIEFLVDKDHQFYFLEMNTRLQVEHPVTEMVTGIDIVKEQLHIAAGRRLRFKQEDIRLNGWAIECRINAEDPYNYFLPSTGIITQSILPTGPGIRVDTGIYAGFAISPFYDSLISKIICWAETREEAILRMRRALDEYRILGVKTSIPFHQNLISSQQFVSGQFNTRFVEEQFSINKSKKGEEELEKIALIMATLVKHYQLQKASQILQNSERDTNNWKWWGRRETMDR